MAESIEAIIQRFKANRLHPAAVQALSASADPDRVYKIEQACEKEPEAVTKIVLYDGLGNIGTTKAVLVLDRIARKGGEHLLVSAALRAMGNSRNEEARRCLQFFQRSSTKGLRSVAEEALAELEKSLAPPKPKPILPAHLLKPAEEPAEGKPREPTAQPPAPPQPAAQGLPPARAPVPAETPSARPAAPAPAPPAKRRGPSVDSAAVAALVAAGKAHEVPVEAAFRPSPFLDKLKAAGVSTLGELAGHSWPALRSRAGLSPRDRRNVKVKLARLNLAFAKHTRAPAAPKPPKPRADRPPGGRAIMERLVREGRPGEIPLSLFFKGTNSFWTRLSGAGFKTLGELSGLESRSLRAKVPLSEVHQVTLNRVLRRAGLQPLQRPRERASEAFSRVKVPLPLSQDYLGLLNEKEALIFTMMHPGKGPAYHANKIAAELGISRVNVYRHAAAAMRKVKMEHYARQLASQGKAHEIPVDIALGGTLGLEHLRVNGIRTLGEAARHDSASLEKMGLDARHVSMLGEAFARFGLRRRE